MRLAGAVTLGTRWALPLFACLLVRKDNDKHGIGCRPAEVLVQPSMAPCLSLLVTNPEGMGWGPAAVKSVAELQGCYQRCVFEAGRPCSAHRAARGMRMLAAVGAAASACGAAATALEAQWLCGKVAVG